MFSELFHWISRSFAPFFLTALTGALFSSSLFAQPLSPSDYRNISNLQDADLAVEQVLQKCGDSGEVILYQVGERLPPDLDWMIKRLAQHRVRVTLYRVTEEELQGELTKVEQAPVELRNLLTFRPDGTRSSFQGFIDRGRRLVSRLFGVQRTADLSLWIPVKRETEIIKMDRVRGLYAGLTAGASLGLSLVSSYAKSGQPLGAEMIQPIAALGTWVALNVSRFRSIGQLMSQGKSLQQTSNGWRVLPNSPFFWSTSFLRSMITNAIVQVSMSGWGALLDGAAMETNLTNSFWSVVSRTEIDKYIASKTPTLRDEHGNIVIGPGQWTEKQAANVNFWWNFSHGMVKNLHLIQFDPMLMTYVFSGLAAINAGFFLKEQLPGWLEQVARFGKSMEEGVYECKTLLVVESH